MKKEFDMAINLAGKIADYWLPIKIQYEHTPGAVVCVAVNGVPKYLKAFGYSDVEEKIKMKTDAQFRVASMSKMFTAVAILQLQEKGKLKIDDSVSFHLKWFKGKNGKADLANVTIKQFLNHTAGLWSDGDTKHWNTGLFPTDVTDKISQKKIIFPSGTHFKYSNYGYAVLGRLIAELSGETYQEYVTKNIIQPLKLKNTLPDLPATLPKKLVRGYKRWIINTTKSSFEQNSKTNAYSAAAGFISSAEDMAVFLASLNIKAKTSILKKESRVLMQTVKRKINDQESYGLGLCLDKFSGQETYGHAGVYFGYATNAISQPQDNIQVIVLTNTISNFAESISNSLLRIIYKIKSTPNIKSVTKEPYSGVYRNQWSDYVVVPINTEKLISFNPTTDNPSENWFELKKQKPNIFSNLQKGGGFAGEDITFKNIKNRKAKLMSADWGDSERVL